MWDYSNHEQSRYGGDDVTYIKAAEFLKDGPVEDWGCGTAYAKRFFKGSYIGVDWAPGFADRVVDLTTYTSKTSGILLRHVLEHNFGWERILNNALASAKKIALVVFTPFGKTTVPIGFWKEIIPDISFCKENLTCKFPQWKEETVSSKTQYGTETIFYIQCGR